MRKGRCVKVTKRESRSIWRIYPGGTENMGNLVSLKCVFSVPVW